MSKCLPEIKMHSANIWSQYKMFKQKRNYEETLLSFSIRLQISCKKKLPLAKVTLIKSRYYRKLLSRENCTAEQGKISTSSILNLSNCSLPRDSTIFVSPTSVLLPFQLLKTKTTLVSWLDSIFLKFRREDHQANYKHYQLTYFPFFFSRQQIAIFLIQVSIIFFFRALQNSVH